MYNGPLVELKCSECGIAFVGHPRSIYCEECRPIARARQRAISRNRKKEKARKSQAAHTKKVEKNHNSIIEIAKAAKAMGMTYGEYVAAGCPMP